MKSILTLIVMCLAFSVPVVPAQSVGDAKDEYFRISSRNSAFGVQGEFEGTYRVTKYSVEVYVKKGMLYVSEHCPYQGRRRINYIKFGLGNQTDSSWRVENSSLPLNLNVIMTPREEYPLAEIHFSVPKGSSEDLALRWFVVEIQEDALDVAADEVEKGYAFAHSCEYISSGTGDDVAANKKRCQKL